MRSYCSEIKQPAPLVRSSRIEGGLNSRGSWLSTLDALPGMVFTEGVSYEADSGEFSDDLWSNQSHGRLGRTYIYT